MKRQPQVLWREHHPGSLSFGYDGGDGVYLPYHNSWERGYKKDTWVELGRVLQNGEHGFCAYAIGREDGAFGFRMFKKVETAKRAVEKRALAWLNELVQAVAVFEEQQWAEQQRRKAKR